MVSPFRHTALVEFAGRTNGFLAVANGECRAAIEPSVALMLTPSAGAFLALRGLPVGSPFAETKCPRPAAVLTHYKAGSSAGLKELLGQMSIRAATGLADRGGARRAKGWASSSTACGARRLFASFSRVGRQGSGGRDP